MNGPKPKKRRDPLLEAADALEAGYLTHEQLRAMNTPEAVAQGTKEETDLGPLAAAGLGAARGASFGLGDLVQRLTLTPAERAAVSATASQHPYATAAGTATGAAIPFLLTGGESAAALPGLGVRGTQVALGAAQGAGLTPGGAGDRALGAGLGGATAFAAPYLMIGAGAAAAKLPIIGSLMRRAAGIQAGFPAALTAAGTPEEVAVAKSLGLSVSQVSGRVGSAATARSQVLPVRREVAATMPAPLAPILPTLRATADPLETVPAFARRAATAPPLTKLPLGTGTTLPYYPRGGVLEQRLPPPGVESAPLLGPASPELIVRQTPYAQLMQALMQPGTTPRIRQAILGELQRRGIVGQGLLAPAGP